MLDVVLRPGRERSVVRRHPWILSGAVAEVRGAPAPGALARVVASSGETLGYGHLSPASQIRVRMLVLGTEPPPDDLIARRIAIAADRRARDPLLAGTDAVRLINAEGDELPGLTVDRFGRVLVAKLSSAGMHARRAEIARTLSGLAGVETGLLRADEAAERHEGVAPQGDGDDVLFGPAPPATVWIDERGRRYAVDVRAGQKTGFYLDQRDARDLTERLAGGRSVLDLYAHTGGFAVAAVRGGARAVTLVESSKDALVLARTNVAANETGAGDLAAEYLQADVHRYLREVDRAFDLIVCDPPPLARSKRDVDRAARAYKDAFLFALRRAAPEAYFFAFSCSHHVGADLLGKIVFGASLDAGRPLQLLRELGQPPDHPVSIDHPEGRYLTGVLGRVVG